MASGPSARVRHEVVAIRSGRQDPHSRRLPR
jgi:hypothetical protein